MQKINFLWSDNMKGSGTEFDAVGIPDTKILALEFIHTIRNVGLDFPYSIIHGIGDTGYLTAGAGGAFLTAIESLWCRIGHFEWQYRHV